VVASSFRRDIALAAIGGVLPLGVAGFVVFVIKPGGFEGSILWSILLMPGFIPTAVIADEWFKISPATEPVMFWGMYWALNFAWYFLLSWLFIKLWRFSSARSNSASSASLR